MDKEAGAVKIMMIKTLQQPNSIESDQNKKHVTQIADIAQIIDGGNQLA